MRDQKLYESVGKYIDKYYIDKPDDIKLDKEMKSIFDRISEFRKKKATKKCDAEEDTNIEIDESAVEARQSMLDAYPSLQNMYSADDGNTEVFYLKKVTATFSSFTHEPEVVKF